MVSKVHSCLGLDAFSPIDTSVLIVLRGHHSSWTSVFIYINDISRNIMSNTKLFADDMKVYRILRDTKEDVEELQKDLTRLES